MVKADASEILRRRAMVVDVESGTAACALSLTPKRAAQREGPKGVLLLLVALWYGSSCVAISTSKLCMEIARVPFVLCCSQFASAAAVTRCLLYFADDGKGDSAKARDRGEDRAVGKVAASYTLGFALTNVAFSLASAPFVETVKALEPVSTAALAIVMLGEVEAAPTYIALVPIILGVGLATTTPTGAPVVVGEPRATAASVVLACNACFSLRAVFAKALRRDWPSCDAARSAVALFHRVSVLGLAPLAAVATLNDRVALGAALAPDAPDRLGLLLKLALNGAAYATYNLSSFLVLNRVSTTTHGVLNVFRRVAVISVTAAVFRVPLSPTNAGGIALAVAGILAFAASKTRTADAANANAPSPPWPRAADSPAAPPDAAPRPPPSTT